MIKYILAAVAIAVVAALGFMVNSQSSATPQPTRIAKTDEHRVIFAIGRIEGQSDEIQLRSQLGGRIVALPVVEGQPVRQGQPLMQVDDQQYRQQVALANAQLDLANAELARLINGVRQEARDEARSMLRSHQANLERAQLNWNRVRQLHSDGAVSQQDRDNKRTEVAEIEALVAAAQSRLLSLTAPARPDEVAMARAKIAAAGGRLELAKDTLSKATVYSPVNGTVLNVNSRLGELATPESRSPSILVADTSSYRVRAFVEEIDAPRVKLGMQVDVTADGLANKSFKGHITRLSPRMSRKQMWSDAPAETYDTKTREIWIELQEGQGELVVGLRVNVTIHPPTSTAPQQEVAKTNNP